MEWQSGALGQLTGADWQESGWLSQADPYLVWSDLTGFAGSPLPGRMGRTMPVIEHRSSGSKPTIRTNARPANLREITKLADPAQRKRDGIDRFEIGAGFRSDDPVPAGGSNTGPAVAALPEDERRKEGSRPVVGIIDYGCAFAHPSLRRPDTTLETSVKAIWDQGASGVNRSPGQLQWRPVPQPFLYGAETHRDRHLPGATGHLTLNEYIQRFAAQGWLNEEACYRQSGYSSIQMQDYSHGTAITDLATGWPSPVRSVPGYTDLNTPHDADIVFVQLPRYVNGRQVSGVLRANVLDAVRYILDSTPDDQPTVINLSYGGNAGPHDGTSLLEQALDERMLDRGTAKTFVVVSAGNARKRSLHGRATIGPGATARFDWNSLPDDPSDSFVELWMPNGARASVRVTPPGGRPGQYLSAGAVGHFKRGGFAVAALIYPTRVCQSDNGQMALLASSGTRLGNGSNPAPYGRWIIEVRNDGADAFDMDAWCERDDPPFGTRSAPRQSHFTPTASSLVVEDSTLNSIAHGRETVVVGGYVLGAEVVAASSGTGPARGLSGVAGRPRNLSSGARRGPEFVEASDESPVVAGLAAAAVLGQGKWRMNGTSVAAALMTRRIIEAGFTRPSTRTKSRRSPPSSSHPDNDLVPQDVVELADSEAMGADFMKPGQDAASLIRTITPQAAQTADPASAPSGTPASAPPAASGCC